MQITIHTDILSKVFIQTSVFETDLEEESYHNERWGAFGRSFISNKLKNSLSFEAKVIIKELYNMKGNEVPRDKWINYNVILSK